MFITRISPSRAYRDIQILAQSIKEQSQAIHDNSTVGNISITYLSGYIESLSRSADKLNTLTQTPGLLTYVQDQHTDQPGYDVVAEHTAMRTQMLATVQWALDNLPKDGSGYELAYTRNASGGKVWRSFTPAQTASLRTQLLNLIATIE